MIHCRILPVTLCVASLLSLQGFTFAFSGTSIIASKGQPTYVHSSWPEGVGRIANDPLRTSGWNSWFSEEANDVNQYAFDIKSTDDLNRLITRLAATKCNLRQIRLSYLKEPRGIGWVTSLPEGNGTAVLFSIGDQAQIDEWFKHVRKPFGVTERIKAPEAIPPTLTIFVQNPFVKLEALKIPDGIDVKAGYVPTVFHKFNTKDEQQREKADSKPDRPDSEAMKQKHDAGSLAAMKKIEMFLESRMDRIKP